MKKITTNHLSILIPTVFLLGIGFVMIVSTSSVVGFENYGNSFYFIKKHFIFLMIGIGGFLIGVKVPHGFYKQHALLGFLIGIGLLLLAFIPGVGVKIGGATRWIDIGFFTLQPVEVIKFFVVVFVSTALTNKRDVLGHFFKGIVPILFMVGIPLIFLSQQPDLGNSGLILIVTFLLLFLSEVPLRFMALFFVFGVSVVMANLVFYSYQMQRVLAFLNPWDDPLGRNYHMVQSLIAVGSGGLTGLGLGESKLKYFYLPLQYSDFIFSIVAEEGGFVLSGIIIGLFLWLFFLGIGIAKKADRFGFFLGAGLLMMIVVQAFLNIAVVIGLMPVTGIPLTFISFGGTSLLTSMFYIGVMVNISYATKKNTH